MNDKPVVVRVWDLPTRLFHWLLAAAVVGSVVSAKIGGAAMVWHVRLGLFVMGLLLFRLVWGLVGGHWSRFARFVYGPGTVVRYLRGASRPDEHHEVGHSPIGALSVFAMLAILIVQVSTGLIADDEIATTGPLNRFVATATGLAATGWHKTWGQWLILALVALHLVAVVGYLLIQKKNLILPMIGGDKALVAGVPAAADGAGHRALAAAVAIVAGAVVAYVIRLGVSSSPHRVNEPASVRIVVADTPALLAAARGLFREYAAGLGVDLCFQNFEAELAALPGDYAGPDGTLLLAFAGEGADEGLAGCGALRPLPDVDYPDACEMKRLYVRGAHRGLGVGRLIAQALVDHATQVGYSAMLLDTLDDMEAARGMYGVMGFEEIPPYYFNPIAGAHYLKLDLRSATTLF